MVDHQHSRRVRRGIERLTRANRRRNTFASESSSSNSSSDSDSSTLDPEDFLPITLPRAPPSVLPPPLSQGRTSLPGRPQAEDRMTMAEAEEIIERAEAAELAREEAREVSRRRSNRHFRRGRGAPVGTGITRSDALEVPLPPIRPLSTSQADISTGALVRRFLAQPFLSEGRAAPRIAGSNGTSLATLASIYGDPSVAPSVSRANITEEDQNRRQEFEAFASSRRYYRRSQGASRRVRDEMSQSAGLLADGVAAAREDETFYRAISTLYQADETIRLVSQDADEIDSAATTRREGGARRINLPSMTLSDQRPVHRMPSRPRMREDYHT